MATFAVAGQSVNGGAISVTIPAGSNHAALMVWWGEDAGGTARNAPSVPGGATVSSADLFTLSFRDAVAYHITGLSAGSATFTPPSSSGSQGAILIVASDVDQTTPLRGTRVIGAAGDDWSPNNAPSLTVDTTGDDDLCVMVLMNPTATLPDLAGASGSTLRATSGPSSYGGYTYGLTAPREGATTAIEATYTTTVGSAAYAVAFQAAVGGGGSSVPAQMRSYRNRRAG